MVDSITKQQYLDAQSKLRLQLFQSLKGEKHIKMYLHVLDGLNHYLVGSGKVPSEALAEYYLLLTRCNPSKNHQRICFA